jgi:hypothetical protein
METPMLSIILNTACISEMQGIFEICTGPSARQLAASSARELFLDPGILILPFSGLELFTSSHLICIRDLAFLMI